MTVDFYKKSLNYWKFQNYLFLLRVSYIFENFANDNFFRITKYCKYSLKYILRLKINYILPVILSLYCNTLNKNQYI